MIDNVLHRPAPPSHCLVPVSRVLDTFRLLMYMDSISRISPRLISTGLKSSAESRESVLAFKLLQSVKNKLSISLVIPTTYNYCTVLIPESLKTTS